jgi:hypothetical protein
MPSPQTKVRGPGYHVAKGEDALDAKQWAMVIDTRKFHSSADLEPIIEACNKVHNIPTAIENKNHEIKWIWEAHYHNAFTDKTNHFLNEAVGTPTLSACCATTAKIRPACGPAPPRRPGSGSATASSHGLSSLHRLPVLHGGLSLRCPQLQLQGSRPVYPKKPTRNFPPA